MFRQARQAIPAALEFLGAADSGDAASTLEHGLGNGQCLYRDVRERIGLIQVLPPALPEVMAAFETAPAAAEERVAGTDDDDDGDTADEVVAAPEARGALPPPPRALGVASVDVEPALPDELDDVPGPPVGHDADLDDAAAGRRPDEPTEPPDEALDERAGDQPDPTPVSPADDPPAARARARRHRRSPLADALQRKVP